MNEQFAIALRILNLKYNSATTDCTNVSDLTARFTIEGGPIQNDSDLCSSVFNRFDQLAVADNTNHFGIGVDDTLGGLNINRGKAFDNLQGNLIARLPIESLHLAPYAIAGGGATWGANKAQGNGNVGGGIEYRINRAVGLFIDSRYIYGNNGLNESLNRAGVRLVF